MSLRILHVLSQRPSRTGSGVTLDAVVRQASRQGWRQAAVVGVPADASAPVGDLPPGAVATVTFAAPDAASPADLPFPVPGMSDVMPYPSAVWSRLTADQLAAYRQVWRRRLATACDAFRPDLIHSHHVWLASALVKDVAPRVPQVITCHATGLRQMALCPQLRDEVVAGCRRADAFCALHADQARRLTDVLGAAPERVHVVGAGYRDDLFHPPPAARPAPAGHVAYVGKLSAAKGVPWLLDAAARLAARRPELRLHLVGGGDGDEAEALRRRASGLAPHVALHGPLAQADLAALLRRCRVCVLPSFYEGVPLVLVEAAACGCRLVATALPGVVGELAPHLGHRLVAVPLPRLTGVDTPHPADLPAFVEALVDALDRALSAPPETATPPAGLAQFAWPTVFARVERVWRAVLARA